MAEATTTPDPTTTTTPTAIELETAAALATIKTNSDQATVSFTTLAKTESDKAVKAVKAESDKALAALKTAADSALSAIASATPVIPAAPTPAPAPIAGMTLAEVAILVNIPEAEIMAFNDYGSYVVVVTTSGQAVQVNKP